MTRLRALGGFDAKGPACFLLEIDGARLLLDMGRGPDGGLRPDLDGVDRADAVLISHLHADHTGSLDWLDRIGTPPVFATAPTRALGDSPALRGAEDLPSQGKVAGVSIETGPAGHAPGAVWMRIGGAAGVVYSGDYAAGSDLLPIAPLPPAAVAILDCSYGVEAERLNEQRAALLAHIGDGPCLLPVPPAGRGLDIALDCLDHGLNVAICDQIRNVAEVMTGFPDWLAAGGPARLDQLLRQAGRLHAESSLNGIMIAAGANCGSGLSQELGPKALAAGVPVMFTGHLSQGSPAAEWVAQGRASRRRWNVHPDRPTLTKMLAETGARTVMPAFAAPKVRQTLIDALPDIPWAGERVVTR